MSEAETAIMIATRQSWGVRLSVTVIVLVPEDCVAVQNIDPDRRGQ